VLIPLGGLDCWQMRCSLLGSKEASESIPFSGISSDPPVATVMRGNAPGGPPWHIGECRTRRSVAVPGQPWHEMTSSWRLTKKHPGAQPLTVLIVDDDRATVDMFSHVLRLEGYEVRTAFSAESGMRVVEASRPDAILVDFRLPLGNGVEFLRWLRVCEGCRDIPVAVVTGEDPLDDTLRTELHQLGARVAFKPLLLDELVDLTRRLLANRASGQPPSDVGEHHRMHLSSVIWSGIAVIGFVAVVLVVGIAPTRH
jgi:CheY-like chemotaxis protein